MKTAISLPDDLFAAADALASRLGLSRSQLYATALARFVAEQARAAVPARLNAVPAAGPPAPAAAAEAAADREWLRRAQAHTLAATAPAPDAPGGW